jgi:cobyrinic acid a,c-diamide synthase
MSVPRVLLAPTHHTGVADAIAAAVVEVATHKGIEVGYHHVGPLSPTACWDRWEGSVFVDPALCGDEALLGLYDVAVRHSELSVLSASTGVLDKPDGVKWTPAAVARLLDCPVVLVMDCRGWGTGMKALIAGLRTHLAGANWAGVIFSGVANRDHLELLRQLVGEEGIPVAGCLFAGGGLEWDSPAPGAWGLPLDAALVESVSRQVDIDGLISLAGQRGFLSAPNWLTDRGEEGPVIAVAGGKGFALWSRDSVEVLRAAGARVKRLDLIEHRSLPNDTAGLILAGTLWPGAIPEIAMNVGLLREIGERVRQGLPTLALGGGMLLLLERLQDLLGRSSDLAGVIPAAGEILWDFESPAYVDIAAQRDSLLLAKDERAVGWVLTDAELTGAGARWDSPLKLKGGGVVGERGEGLGTESLLCSPVLLHLAASRDAASRFVGLCAGAGSHHRPYRIALVIKGQVR